MLAPARKPAATAASAGKLRRLARIFDRDDGRTVILPLDGVLVVGCFAGAEDLEPLVAGASDAGADAVMLRYGEARRLADSLDPATGLIVRLSGARDDGPEHTFEPQLASAEGAAALGADAVCATLKLGGSREQELLRDLGRLAHECDSLGLAFLCEVFLYDATGEGDADIDGAARGARIAQDLGADLVKLANPGDAARMRVIVEWCQLPVVVAGGARTDDIEFLKRVAAAIEGGAAGVAAGRNVISHESPPLLQALLSDVVHGRRSIGDAVAKLEAARASA
jgi:class I fructose-bisphosphate aldolase